MKITILGARGSVPIDGKDMLEFGGATSCVLVQTDELALFLDAGTGIIHAPDVGSREIKILLTHPHFDHLIGLPFFPYNGEKGRKIDVYGRGNGEMSVFDNLERLISPPLWPCTIADYLADYEIHEMDSSICIGDAQITALYSRHPGGSLLFRITNKGKSVVYATDYEYDDEGLADITEFCMNTDLLLIDGQYTDEEFAARRGYGHSTVAQGMRIMENAHARNIRFVHHDPRHTDAMLTEMERPIKSENASFARQGEEIVL